MLDLDGLNREQLEAVLATEGPVLVLAGAGSGKTRVITYRLAHLVERGVDPRAILAVTFTNKAASEMRDRAKNLAGSGVRGATISTFHALGAQILRGHGEPVGLRPGFGISDGADQLGSVRRILRNLRIDDRRFDAKRILVTISNAKNAGIDAARFREQGGFLEVARGPNGDPDDVLLDEEYRIAAIEVYERYQSALRAQNVVDFDDLLLLTVDLLERDEAVLASLRSRWRYLMIDEYQDTNGAQLELMRLLAGEERNLCVVGDDDQSIYGWRGADVRNILRFSQHFPGARVVKLETNYRSTGRILEVANAIIRKNAQRHDKKLRPAGELGDPVRIVAVEDEEQEAEEVARAVLCLIAGRTPESEIAVLFRSNAQSRPIELALRRAHVPYRVVGGMDLFDKKEIKDALAYLRVLHNVDDEQALRRVVNYPARGIGDTAVERVDAWARERGLTLPQAVARVHDVGGLAPRSADAIAAFAELISAHRKLLDRQTPSVVAKKLFAAVKLEEALLASTDDPTSGARRVDNVREILGQLERHEKPLDVFLRDLALIGFEEGSTKEERRDQVVLSTIHAAKGLEWSHVFLVGAEEDLLPHRRTVEGDGAIDEERRLAYVAVTRARKRLTVSHARTRTKWGKILPRLRSRFLEDLPEDAIERREGSMRPERSEEEKAQIEKEWRARIRAQLGID